MNNCRLLLIEFIREDPYRNFRSEMYPFFKGLAQKHKIPVLWGRLGIFSDSFEENPFIINLDPADEIKLSGLFKDYNPTHVIFNEKITHSQKEQILKDFAGIRIFDISDPDRENPQNLLHLSQWLGIPDYKDRHVYQSMELLKEVNPDYCSQPLNFPAREFRPFIKILCGPSCLYRKRLSMNPYFSGIDLSRISRKSGCSFCAGDSFKFSNCMTESYMELALRQINAAALSFAEMKSLPPFMLTGTIIFLKIGEFFNHVLKMNLPPSEFYFSCRVDEFLSRSRDINNLLPEIRDKGHSIHIHNMGVENFSSAENERFNKGLNNRDILNACKIIKKFEQKYPETFFFQKHGGFAFILFTPWTSVDDLKENLKMAKFIGIDPDSYFFMSRLQLLEGRPITLLAERDGLVINSSMDMAFDSGCITNWDQKEIPWRFQNPETAVIYHILSRWGFHDNQNDEKSRLIHEFRRSLPPRCQDIYKMAKVLINLMQKHPSHISVENTLQGLHEKLLKSAGKESRSVLTCSIVKIAANGNLSKIILQRLDNILSFFNQYFHKSEFMVAGKPLFLHDGLIKFNLEAGTERSELLISTFYVKDETRNNIMDCKISCILKPFSEKQRILMRIIAAFLDCRYPAGEESTGKTMNTLINGFPLLLLIEESVFPSNGEQLRFGAFKPFWPVALPDKKVSFSLSSDNERLDLYIDKREKSDQYFMKSEKIAISYSKNTVIDTPAKRGAVEKLVERIREIEIKSSAL